MGVTCHNQCTKYKAIGRPSGGKYAKGQKRCSICEIFLNWDGVRCPCCSFKLRTKPRNKKYKDKLREVNQVRRI